jgi:hypothetical protein
MPTERLIMPNRFLQFLGDSDGDLRKFDATDPEHMRVFLEWPAWDVRKQPTFSARHALAVDLALECLEVVAGPVDGPLLALPAEFKQGVQTHLGVHADTRDGTRPGMPEAYVWVMDYLCAALLGWPLEAPLNSGLAPQVLDPWHHLARNLVFQRVNDTCERCRKFLEKPVIGFGAACAAQQVNWAVIAEQIVNRLVSEGLWLAWANEIPAGRDPNALRGDHRAKYHTRMTRHSVKVWIPEELLNKTLPEGETFTFFGHVDRAVQGFATKYSQKYRYRFVGTQFKAGLLPTGMLWPFLQETFGLVLGQICVWQSSRPRPCPNPECAGWKSSKCAHPDCTFSRTGPIDLVRGRLLLASGGRFVLRQVWRCDDPNCVGHERFFFAEKCCSHCKKDSDHDCCPLCDRPHTKGRANRTISAYDYIEGMVASDDDLLPPLAPARPAVSKPPAPPTPVAGARGESGEEYAALQKPEEEAEIGSGEEDSKGEPPETLPAEPDLSEIWKVAQGEALSRFQHEPQNEPPWVIKTIELVTSLTEPGSREWLKALLPGVEVDWEGLHRRVAEAIKDKKPPWKMNWEAFRERFNQRYREELFDSFDQQLSRFDYDVEEVVLALLERLKVEAPL